MVFGGCAFPCLVETISIRRDRVPIKSRQQLTNEPTTVLDDIPQPERGLFSPKAPCSLFSIFPNKKQVVLNIPQPETRKFSVEKTGRSLHRPRSPGTWCPSASSIVPGLQWSSAHALHHLPAACPTSQLAAGILPQIPSEQLRAARPRHGLRTRRPLRG